MLNLEMIYVGTAAAQLLLFVISTAYILGLRQNARELRGRIASLKESLIISRNKESIALHELTKTGRELKQTKELLAKAERAAIIPEHPEPVGLISSELEPVKLCAEIQRPSFLSYGEMQNLKRITSDRLRAEIDPYIKWEDDGFTNTRLTGSLTILKEK